MSLNILEKQNEAQNLALLASQRQFYNRAKRWMTFRLYSSLLLLLYPLLLAFFPSLGLVQGYLPFAGVAIVALTYLWIKPREKSFVEMAAKIQERFDVAVLEIPDNPLEFYENLSDVAVRKAALKHLAAFDIKIGYFQQVTKEQWVKTGLYDWYAIPSNISQTRAALFCQKSNLFWDMRQRKFFTNLFLMLALVVFILPLAVAYYCQLTTPEYVNKILVLSLPFLLLCFDNYRAHHDILMQQQQSLYALTTTLRTKEDPEKDLLRNTQNAIYHNRNQVALVPNWLYKILRRNYENDMKTDAAILQ